jgi:hypothetical protein
VAVRAGVQVGVGLRVTRVDVVVLVRGRPGAEREQGQKAEQPERAGLEVARDPAPPRAGRNGRVRARRVEHRPSLGSAATRAPAPDFGHHPT